MDGVGRIRERLIKIARGQARMAALLAMAVALGALLPIGTTSAESTPSPRYNCVTNGLLLQSWLPCDYGTKVPDLLNPMFLLEDVNAFGTLYGATDAQRAALNSFQDRAIRNIMALHGLPAADYQAVKAWARPEALEELWAMVIDAIETHPEVRTQEQRLVSEWMHKVLDRQRNASTEQAAREYVKWAGLDPRPLERALARPGLIADTTAFADTMRGEPLNHGATAGTGYCDYVAPDPFAGAYLGGGVQMCATPCTSVQGCPPPYPEVDDFIRWGAARVNNTLYDEAFLDLVHSSLAAIGLTASLGVAALAGGIAHAQTTAYMASVTSQIVTRLATNGNLTYTPLYAAWQATTSVLAKVFPHALTGSFSTVGGQVVSSTATAAVTTGITTVAANAAATVAVVVGAIVNIVQMSVEIARQQQIPDKIAEWVANSRALLVNGNPDDLYIWLTMELFGTDWWKAEARSAMHALLLAAALPDPVIATCSNLAANSINGEIPALCLNAPPLPPARAGDPTFEIRRRDGQGQVTTAPSITTTVLDGTVVTTSRVSGKWIVQRTQFTDGEVVDFQSLNMTASNWAGEEIIVQLVRNLDGTWRFVRHTLAGPDGVITDDPLCAEGEASCNSSSELEFVGIDGVQYAARLVDPPPPPPDVTSPTMEFDLRHIDKTPVPAMVIYYSEPLHAAVRPTFQLRRNGELVAEIRQSDLPYVQLDGRYFYVPLPWVTGQAEFEFRTLNAGVVDLSGNPVGSGDESVTWRTDVLPTVQFTQFGAPLETGPEAIDVIFSEPVRNFDAGTLQLFHDGRLVEAPGLSVVHVSAAQQFRVEGLAAVASAEGAYDLRFRPDHTVTDHTYNPVEPSGTGFVVDALPTVTIDEVSWSDVPVDRVTARFSEPVAGFTASNLRVERDGQLLETSAVVIAEGPEVFTIAGIGAELTGSYTVTIDPAANPIRDAQGRPMQHGASISFQVVIPIDPNSTTTVPGTLPGTTTTTSSSSTTTTTVPESTTPTTTVPESTTTTTTLPESTTTTLPKSSTTTSSAPPTTTTLPESTTTTPTTTSSTPSTTPSTTTASTSVPGRSDRPHPRTTSTTAPPASATTSTVAATAPAVWVVPGGGQTPRRPRPVTQAPVTTSSLAPRAAGTGGAATRPIQRTMVVVGSPAPTTSIAAPPATTVSSQTTAEMVVRSDARAAQPSGDGAGSADQGQTRVISRQASGSGLGPEWSALMASTLAALVGGWYAFQRNRRPTVRLGDDS